MSTIHHVRAKLLDQKSIYRDIEIKSSATLYQLAEAIIHAFSFHFDHAFGFYSNCSASTYSDSAEKYELFTDMSEESVPGAKGVKKTKLTQALRQPKQKMLFLFDYGDDWMFEIEVLDSAGELQKGVRYPRVTQSKGKAPEQYPACEDDAEEEEFIPLALEGSMAKKFEMNEKFRKMAEIFAKNPVKGLEDIQKQMEDLGFKHLDDDIKEIEAMEVEEEAKAKPENANQRKLVKFFEGSAKPNEALLNAWFAEKWENPNSNFPLFRKYAKQDNQQMLSLLFFGLDNYPITPELLQDMEYFYNQLDDHDRSPLIKRIVIACDLEDEDMNLFQELAYMLFMELSGADENIIAVMKDRYKKHPVKHSIVNHIVERETGFGNVMERLVATD